MNGSLSKAIGLPAGIQPVPISFAFLPARLCIRYRRHGKSEDGYQQND
jgi:hypothetical protein